jgi:hypothetical protein
MSTALEPTTVRICIPEPLRPHSETALARLGYLHPSVRFDLVDGAIQATMLAVMDATTLESEIRYALYREKIYAETLALRHSLVDAVTRR